MASPPWRRGASGQIVGLLEAFEGVPDPRKPQGVWFSLAVVLGLAQLATVCGARTFVEIAEVAADVDAGLAEPFGLVRAAPSAATFRRVLCAVDPGALDEAVTRWALGLPPAPEGQDPPEATPEPEPTPMPVRGRVSMDGKSLRGGRVSGAAGKRSRVAVLEAVDHDTRAVLGQEQIIGGDEIAAGQAMVARLVAQVGAASGYWILPAKHNQPGIAAVVEQLPWPLVPALDVTCDKSHGRAETETLPVVELPAHAPATLAGAAQAIRVFRHVKRKKSPTAEAAWTRDSAYLLTSLPPEAATPAELAAMIRGHRLAESLYLTATPCSTRTRHTARTGHGPVKLTCLRNTAITRLHQTGHHDLQPSTRACNRRPTRAIDIIASHQDQL